MTDSSVISSRHIIVVTYELDNMCTNCQHAPQTQCSRCKCRGARAWSGWARRGGRACGMITGTIIPHCLSKRSFGVGHGRKIEPIATHDSAAVSYTISRLQQIVLPKGMGKAAEVASDGGSAPRNGGAGDAGEVSRRCRTAWATTKYTAARRRIRARRTSTVTSPLSASRADEKQLPASSKQMRERCSRMGGVSRECRCAKRQEGWAITESDTVVGADGCAASARPAAGEHSAAVRDGAEARAASAARRVTPPASASAAAISRLHSIIGTVARASRSIIDLVFIYSGAGRS